MPAQQSTLDPFEVGGVVFQCWSVPDGKNELGLPAVRSEWRSGNGRLAVWRQTGTGWHIACVGGVEIARHLPSLKAAMVASVNGARVGNRKAG